MVPSPLKINCFLVTVPTVELEHHSTVPKTLAVAETWSGLMEEWERLKPETDWFGFGLEVYAINLQAQDGPKIEKLEVPQE